MAEYKWEVDNNQLILKEKGDSASDFTSIATISGGLHSDITGTFTPDQDLVDTYLTFTPYQAAVAADPDANPPVVAQNEAKGTITLKEAALGTSDITLTSTGSHYTLALEGADATSGELKLGDAEAEKWTVTNDSSTTASHYAAGTPTTYTLADNKITYAAKSTPTADITITGLKPMMATALAPLITITPKAADASAETKGTITIAAGALPDNPTDTTSVIALTTGTENYNLELASGIAMFDSTKGQPEIKAFTGSTATITRTQSAGWQAGSDTDAGKKFTYKEQADKTLATISNLKNGATTSDLTISVTTVTLKEGALDSTCGSSTPIAVTKDARVC